MPPDDADRSGLLRVAPRDDSSIGRAEPGARPLDLREVARLVDHGKLLTLTAEAAAIGIHIALLFSTWGHPRLVWLQLILWLVPAIANPLVPLLFPIMGPERAALARNVFNHLLHLPLGICLGWPLPVWLFLPFFTALAAVPPARRVFSRTLVQIISFDVVALCTGARWQDALLFTGISVFFYLITSSYLSLLGNLLAERDQTLHELRAAQQRVIKQEKMASIGQVAAGVAHEINNPMCFVTANVEAMLLDLQAGALSEEHCREYREDILPETLDGIRRVNAIVDDLRRFARGEPEQFVPLDLTGEIHAAVRMARSQLRPGQELIVELPERLDVVGSPRQLCQAILNLVMNALQALPAHAPGKVELSARTKNGTVEVAIRDNGSGMTEETKQRLFEPFFSTKARLGQGLGLGLSVVYGIVKAHAGTIEVESVLGRGTCFRIRLPDAASTAAAIAAA